MSRRHVAIAALSLTLGVGLTGCGNDIASYCGDLRSDQQEFATMLDNSSPTALVDHLPMLKALAGASPDDLTDEWQTFNGAVSSLADALHAAGVKPSDFKDGKAPAGLSAAELQGINDAADELSSQTTVEAADGIDQQARDVCKLNLGM